MPVKEWSMRRKDRKMEEKEIEKLLQENRVGILATVGEEGEPYAVPLSYVLMEDSLYFHCAKTGRKLENIRHQNRVCFTVSGENEPMYKGDFTTTFESVVVEGHAFFVEEKEEKTKALLALVEKYLPAHMDKAPDNIEKSFSATQVVRIEIELISGKTRS